MQRPAKPWTPVRFRPPPPIHRSHAKFTAMRHAIGSPRVPRRVFLCISDGRVRCERVRLHRIQHDDEPERRRRHADAGGDRRHDVGAASGANRWPGRKPVDRGRIAQPHPGSARRRDSAAACANSLSMGVEGGWMDHLATTAVKRHRVRAFRPIESPAAPWASHVPTKGRAHAELGAGSRHTSQVACIGRKTRVQCGSHLRPDGETGRHSGLKIRRRVMPSCRFDSGSGHHELNMLFRYIYKLRQLRLDEANRSIATLLPLLGRLASIARSWSRPCPFCGHVQPDFAEFTDTPPLQRCAVVCPECGAIRSRTTDPMTACIAWNNRP